MHVIEMSDLSLHGSQSGAECLSVCLDNPAVTTFGICYAIFHAPPAWALGLFPK